MAYLILTLATWRITSLLVNEYGPFNLLERMRYRLGVRYDESLQRIGTNVVAEAFTCMWCLSVWVGLVLSIALYAMPVLSVWLLLPFALSAGAIVIERLKG